MKHPLLRLEVQEFIRDHEHTPIHKLILKGSPFPDITIQEIAQQIDGRNRTKNKLPLWYETEGILYPPKLNLEQTSSSTTAIYKSHQIKGGTLLDTTGGFGVDSYYFSKTCKQITHVEMDETLSSIATHNFKILGANNIKTIQAESIEYLKKMDTTYDTIFIDPARRSETNSRVFKLKDCTPDVVQNLDLLLTHCTDLWIKTAPMLDITAGLRVLHSVRSVYIIAVKNEVKELLWHLSLSDTSEEVQFKAVNLSTEQEEINGTLSDIESAQATYHAPQKYLYEPNASLLKSGAFQWLSSNFNISKLHEHTHLYTSDALIAFPGRRFQINAVLPYSKRLKKELPVLKAHITTRNFRLSVKELRKQLSIKEGGETYLFFTTSFTNKPVVLVCSKV